MTLLVHVEQSIMDIEIGRMESLCRGGRCMRLRALKAGRTNGERSLDEGVGICVTEMAYRSSSCLKSRAAKESRNHRKNA